MIPAAQPSLVAVRLPATRAWEAIGRVWDRGDAVLPLAVDAPTAAIEATIAALRPSAVIDDDGRRDVRGGVAVAPGTALVVGTSGSTGKPKGVVLSHAALESSARASLARLSASADDRWLCCLPLHHVAGLQVLLRGRLAGATVTIHDSFDAEAVAAAAAAGSMTMVSLVPTMLRRLLHAGADLSRLRCVLLGGAPASAQLLDDARRAGVPVVTTYGMTETCGGCVYDGRPLDGVEVRLDAEGRIWLRGPMLMSGYRLDDETTSRTLVDGWLRTDDLGRWASDGRLEVLGRDDDVIVTGGEKIAAGAVAQLLERHPDVVEAAVTGVADPQWGQRVVAFVVAGPRPPTLAALRDFVRAVAPAHAAPRQLVIVDALPRLPSGKVDRLALRTD